MWVHINVLYPLSHFPSPTSFSKDTRVCRVHNHESGAYFTSSRGLITLPKFKRRRYQHRRRQEAPPMLLSFRVNAQALGPSSPSDPSLPSLHLSLKEEEELETVKELSSWSLAWTMAGALLWLWKECFYDSSGRMWSSFLRDRDKPWN